MLQYSGSRFRLYPWKAKFERNGETVARWALPSKEWWESSADRQGFEVEFEEVTLTEEQQERYDKIRRLNIAEGHRSLCIDYILDGGFGLSERNLLSHPLKDLVIEGWQELQDDELEAIVDMLEEGE